MRYLPSSIRLRDILIMLVFFFNDTATTEIYTLSLHDALPIFLAVGPSGRPPVLSVDPFNRGPRKVGGEDPTVVLPRARPAERSPLAQPHAVPRSRPGRHEPAH